MNTKTIVSLASLFLAPVIGASAQAQEVTVKLENVHLCCQSCVKDADDAVAAVPGASASSDLYKKSVVITAPDKATADKAVAALVAAGYYGTSPDASVMVPDLSGAKDVTVHTMTVSGVHLCCDKCANTAKKALAAVPGVKGDNCAKDVQSFQVTGEFNEKNAIAALNKAGLSGTVTQAE